jgi:HSP20 family protein
MYNTETENRPETRTLEQKSGWEPTYVPRTDILEHDEHYEIVVELPGVAPDAIDLQVEKHDLRVTATRRAPENGNARAYLLRERRNGTFVRTFHLGDMVDRNAVEAKMEDGILRIRVPKAVQALPRKIAIA